MAGDAQPYQYLVESIRKWHDQVLSCLYLSADGGGVSREEGRGSEQRGCMREREGTRKGGVCYSAMDCL